MYVCVHVRVHACVHACLHVCGLNGQSNDWMDINEICRHNPWVSTTVFHKKILIMFPLGERVFLIFH